MFDVECYLTDLELEELYENAELTEVYDDDECWID